MCVALDILEVVSIHGTSSVDKKAPEQLAAECNQKWAICQHGFKLNPKGVLMLDRRRNDFLLRRKHDCGTAHKYEHKNDRSQAVSHRGIPFAQSRDHGNNDDPNSGNRDIGKGDPHSGQLRPFVRILS